MSKKQSRPLKKANRKLNNKRNQLQGLIEPTHMATARPERRLSRVEELDKELVDIQHDLLHRQGSVSIEESLVDEGVPSNGTGRARGDLQPKKSKKTNKKKQFKLKPPSQSNTSTSRQIRHNDRGSRSQSAQSEGGASVQTSQDKAFSQHESADGNGFLSHSTRSDNLTAYQTRHSQTFRSHETADEGQTENELPSEQSGTSVGSPPTVIAIEPDVLQQDVTRKATLSRVPLKVKIDVGDSQSRKADHHEDGEAPEPEFNTIFGHLDTQQSPIEDDAEYQLGLHLPDILSNHDEHPDSGYSSPSTDAHYDFASELQGLHWVYTTRQSSNKDLDDTSAWQWERPTTYYRPKSVSCEGQSGSGCCNSAPVIISHERTGMDETRIEYDGKIVQIFPHARPWGADVRSDISHPDFLVSPKLVEYQAAEIAGYRVWRHDRDLLKCRYPCCETTTSDYDNSTVICSGCGPKTIVRYCCFQHQVADSAEHWQECGHPELVMRGVIDHATEPAHFAEFCPAISEKHGVRSPTLHRQRLLSTVTYGLYTLFYPLTGESKTMLWPREDPACIDMNERMERLMCVALFDCHARVVGHPFAVRILFVRIMDTVVRRTSWGLTIPRTCLDTLVAPYEIETNPYTT